MDSTLWTEVRAGSEWEYRRSAMQRSPRRLVSRRPSMRVRDLAVVTVLALLAGSSSVLMTGTARTLGA